MTVPSDVIRILPKVDTCADCIYRSYNKEIKKLWCTKHKIPLPRLYPSKRKSLYHITCDDVLIATVNLDIESKNRKERTLNNKGQTFEEWWDDVLYLFDSKNCSHFLNKDDPDFYKEYFLDNDSPDVVYQTYHFSIPKKETEPEYKPPNDYENLLNY